MPWLSTDQDDRECCEVGLLILHPQLWWTETPTDQQLALVKFENIVNSPCPKKVVYAFQIALLLKLIARSLRIATYLNEFDLTLNDNILL